MFGDADSANPDLAGTRDQVAGRQIRVRAAPIRMQMEVDGEVGPIEVAASGWSHRAFLFWRFTAEGDFLDVIANLDLINHVHAFDDAAEYRVLAVKKRRGLETDIELAPARFALGIYLITLARHRQRAAKVFL